MGSPLVVVLWMIIVTGTLCVCIASGAGSGSGATPPVIDPSMTPTPSATTDPSMTVTADLASMTAADSMTATGAFTSADISTTTSPINPAITTVGTNLAPTTITGRQPVSTAPENEILRVLSDRPVYIGIAGGGLLLIIILLCLCIGCCVLCSKRGKPAVTVVHDDTDTLLRSSLTFGGIPPFSS